MMKHFLSLLILCLVASSVKAHGDHGKPTPNELRLTWSQKHIRLSAEQGGRSDWTNWLTQELYPNRELTLKPIKEIESRSAEHRHFQLYYQELPITGAQVHLHLLKDQARAIVDFPLIPYQVNPQALAATLSPSLIQELGGNKHSTPQYSWWSNGQKLEKVSAFKLWGDHGLEYQVILTGETVLGIYDARRHNGDSLISAPVFLPDPLTTANVFYGGNYQDNNDQDSPELNNQRVNRSFRVKYTSSSGLFELEDPNIKIADFDSPNIAPATSTNGQFQFTRSQDGFEDVNAFYHLVNFKSHVDDLGYGTIPGNQIWVDVHAIGGADNSFYNTSQMRIYMGEGGVDDAEDADVVVHEYVHALITEASPNFNRNTERATMEEAICDYFALSYSLEYSPNQSDRVFNWDGHNPFWPGRNASSSKNYQQISFSGSIYAHTDLFVSCLREVLQNSSRNISDALVLESIFSLTNTSSYRDFALAMLRADSLLFGANNQQVIVDAFKRRSVLDASFSVNGFDFQNQLWKVYNQFGFAKGEALILKKEKPLSGIIILRDNTGRELLQIDSPAEQMRIELLAPELKSGLYFLEIQSAGRAPNQITKLLRL
jgi:hypothetical protein